MSKRADKDTPFQARLRKACHHAQINYSQSVIGRLISLNKSTVDQWMTTDKPTEPTKESLFTLAEALHVDAKWLATGLGEMIQNGKDDLRAPQEQILLENYRKADPRWKLSLQLLASLANEDTIEASSDVNMIVARIFGMKPGEIAPKGDKYVRGIIGDAPHVKSKTEKS